MTDLSNWNAALEFTGEQAAALVVGVEPNQPGYVRTISGPVYERMEQSYAARRKRHQQTDDEVLHEKAHGLSYSLNENCRKTQPSHRPKRRKTTGSLGGEIVLAEFRRKNYNSFGVRFWQGK